MKSTNSKVNDFFVEVQTALPDKYETVDKIRKTFFEANPEITEDIKYGGIVFNVGTRLVGGIFLYKQHISIEFSDGATFTDPKKTLEGKGKMRRHLKILEIGDIEKNDTNSFIVQAVKV